METWPEIIARHKREKLELISSMADIGIPAAAKALHMNEAQLRTYAWHNDIVFWSQSSGHTATWCRPVRRTTE